MTNYLKLFSIFVCAMFLMSSQVYATKMTPKVLPKKKITKVTISEDLTARYSMLSGTMQSAKMTSNKSNPNKTVTITSSRVLPHQSASYKADEKVVIKFENRGKKSSMFTIDARIKSGDIAKVYVSWQAGKMANRNVKDNDVDEDEVDDLVEIAQEFMAAMLKVRPVGSKVGLAKHNSELANGMQDLFDTKLDDVAEDY